MANDICKFAMKDGKPFCKFYDKDAYTCNEVKSESDRIYCGYYREHLKFQITTQFDQMFQALDFVQKRKLAGE